MLTVLRIGHRPERDKRITTHVCLVARAFSADHIMVDTADKELERTFEGVSDRFGHGATLETGVKWRKVIQEFDGTIVHLTMYGMEVNEAVGEIRKSDCNDILIILGAEKVPGEIYKAADFNVSIGNQPHSEVAALAIFLDRLHEGKPFADLEGKLRIIPSNEGKVVREVE